MELIIWNENKSKKPITKGLGFMLAISETEAYAIINTLSEQLLNESGNGGRKEFYTKKGEYFSISVTPKPIEKKEVCKKCGLPNAPNLCVCNEIEQMLKNTKKAKKKNIR